MYLLFRVLHMLAPVHVQLVAQGRFLVLCSHSVVHMQRVPGGLVAGLLRLAAPENHVVQRRLLNAVRLRALLLACLDWESSGACGERCKQTQKRGKTNSY